MNQVFLTTENETATIKSQLGPKQPLLASKTFISAVKFDLKTFLGDFYSHQLVTCCFLRPRLISIYFICCCHIGPRVITISLICAYSVEKCVPSLPRSRRRSWGCVKNSTPVRNAASVRELRTRIRSIFGKVSGVRNASSTRATHIFWRLERNSAEEKSNSFTVPFATFDWQNCALRGT